MANTHNKDSERRRYKRKKAEFIVTYKTDKPLEMHMWVGNREINALMLDLSDVGMAILTKYDIPIPTIILIKFTLINLCASRDDRIKSIEMTGEVRHNTLLEGGEYRLGIFFTQLSKKDRRIIANFVKMAIN